MLLERTADFREGTRESPSLHNNYFCGKSAIQLSVFQFALVFSQFAGTENSTTTAGEF